MSLIKLFKKKYINELFTTPSHSQKYCLTPKFRQFYKFDISETDTHSPEEALENAEKKASKIYGTKSTHFLTNGSSSGVIASVLACAKSGDKVLIWGNAHRCHRNAVELSGATPVYYSLEKDEKWGIYKAFDHSKLDEMLSREHIQAMIVTSPSYEGVVSDIKSIKEICQKHGCALIVDEAHGALYPFYENLPQTAIPYADFTVQSLHKTAGGLNPTALLHCNCDYDISSALEKITTTSPSYPLLMSIERNIDFLNSKKNQKILKNIEKNLKILKNSCTNFEFFDGDFTKIVIRHQKKSGYEISEELYEKFHIEDERTNEKSTMLLCGIGTDIKKIKKLESALKRII